MSNLQIHYHFKLDFQKVDQNTGDKWSTAPNTARTISCKAWNSPFKYPSREYKHDIKESEGNKFNPKRMSRGRNIQEVRIYRAI